MILNNRLVTVFHVLVLVLVSINFSSFKSVVVDVNGQSFDNESVNKNFYNESIENTTSALSKSIEINDSNIDNVRKPAAYPDSVYGISPPGGGAADTRSVREMVPLSQQAADPDSIREMVPLSQAALSGSARQSVSAYNYGYDKVFSLSVNKYHFIPGETIDISGSYYNQENKSFLPATGLVEIRLVDITNSSYVINNPKEIMTNLEYLKYYKNVYVENGTFADQEFTAPNEFGKYLIRLSPLNDPTYPNISDIIIEVVNPFLTIPFIMMYVGLVSFIGLMITIIKSGSIGFTTNEVSRFIFISGIVISPILGLLFSDSELGTNSPIGLIRKHSIDGDQEKELETQWVINVGGLKSDNYTSGILIPIYVLIFGLTGGYLRYLYRTTTSKWNINTKENFLIFEFKWTDVPGNNKTSMELKEYLINKFDADWIRDRDFEKSDNDTIRVTSPDNTKTLQIKLDRNVMKAIVELGDSKIPYPLQVKVTGNNDFILYDTTNRKIWSFYQSLAELALLFLAPLLAIATWFILTQGEDIDKYIVAVISLAVGLVTERIVNYLIGFTSSTFTFSSNTNK